MSSYAPELSYYPLTPDVVDVLKNVIIEAGLAYIAYGMQAALTLAAVRILLRREARARFMLAAIIGLFVVSTLAVVTDIEYYLVQFPSALGTSPEDIQAVMNGLDIVGVVTVRLSRRDRRLASMDHMAGLPPYTMDVTAVYMRECRYANSVGAIVNSYWNIKSITTYERIPMTRTLVMTVPLLFTNIVATTCIAVKVWWYRRDIKGALGLFARKSQVERVLVLLLETGFIYCVLWSNDSGVGFTPMQILSVVIPFVTGLYPPVIVIITLQSNKTQSLLQSAQISHALRFAGPPDAQADGKEENFPPTAHSSILYPTQSSSANDSLAMNSTEASERIVEMARALTVSLSTLRTIRSMDTQASTLYRPLNAEYVHQLKHILTETALNFSFYGVQSILLFIAAWFILSRRNGRSRFMLGALVALFSCSSMVVIAHEVSYVVQTPSEVGTASKQAIKPFILRVDVLLAVAQRFNFVVSDIIVAWRAWVIWSGSRVARGILAVSVGSGLVGAIIECVWVLERLITTNTTISKPMYYRRDVKGNLGLSTKRTQVEKVLTMLVESGSVYCLIWLAHLIAQSVIGAAGFTPTRLVDTALHSISAIYPTVVVLIAMHSNTTQTLLSSQISHALNFAGGADAQNASAVEENIVETQDNGELGSTTSSSA
ncbi:hypothetical protein K525DRAFT_211421 [Schizophyllum commune Loenen D]|nr:hypothetical protein K525DRAFT_211421 [Schizophyllum commune Loenen D]